MFNAINRDINWKFFIIIASILLLPVKNIELYVAAITLLLIFFAIELKLIINSTSIFYILFCGIYIMLSDVRYIILQYDLRDFFEFFKFIPFIILISYKKKVNIEKALYYSLILYTIIDLIISVKLISNLNHHLGVVSDLYHSEHHLGKSRVIGMHPGPSQHGLWSALSAVFFYIHFIIKIQRKKLTLVALFTSVFLLFLSQSQTAIIAFTITFIFTNLLLFFTNKGVIRLKIIVLSIIFVLFTTAVILVYLDELRYFLTIFEHGLERSSYLNRMEKLNYLISLAVEHPVGMVFGFGKSFFGDYSTSMDNGFLYAALVYGLLPSFVFFVFILYLVVKLTGYCFHQKDLLAYFFLSFYAFGVIYNWPSNFFFKPNVMLFIALSIYYLDYIKFLVKSNTTTYLRHNS